MEALLAAARQQEEFRRRYEVEAQILRGISVVEQLRKEEEALRPYSVVAELRRREEMLRPYSVVEELRTAEESRKHLALADVALREAEALRQEAATAALVREARENRTRIEMGFHLRENERYSPPEIPRIDMGRLMSLYPPPPSPPPAAKVETLVKMKRAEPTNRWQKFHAWLNSKAEEHRTALSLTAFLISALLALLALRGT